MEAKVDYLYGLRVCAFGLFKACGKEDWEIWDWLRDAWKYIRLADDYTVNCKVWKNEDGGLDVYLGAFNGDDALLTIKNPPVTMTVDYVQGYMSAVIGYLNTQPFENWGWFFT